MFKISRDEHDQLNAPTQTRKNKKTEYIKTRSVNNKTLKETEIQKMKKMGQQDKGDIAKEMKNKENQVHKE